MRVLVINPDTSDTGESSYLAGAVARRGCEVITAGMREGLALLGEVDVALLNVGRCEADAVAAVEAIRAESDLPLVVMATRASADRCAEVLLAGADDYLGRLVNIDELMVRIQVLLRRHRGSQSSSWRLVAGDVEIDLERRIVLVAGDPVDLTTTEFRILSVIARQGGRVCTKERLLSTVWGDTPTQPDTTAGAGADTTAHTRLRACIAALRSKLARPGLIETVEFVGYRLATRPTVRCADTRAAVSTRIARATCGAEGA